MEASLSNTITFPTFQDQVDQEEKPRYVGNYALGIEEPSVILQLTEQHIFEDARIKEIVLETR